MVLSFFPRQVIFGVEGLEEAKKPSGEKVLRLIQIRFSDAEFCKNLANLSNQFAAQGVAPYESRDAPETKKRRAPPSSEMRVICYKDRTNPSSRVLPNFYIRPRPTRSPIGLFTLTTQS